MINRGAFIDCVHDCVFPISSWFIESSPRQFYCFYPHVGKHVPAGGTAPPPPNEKFCTVLPRNGISNLEICIGK